MFVNDEDAHMAHNRKIPCSKIKIPEAENYIEQSIMDISIEKESEEILLWNFKNDDVVKICKKLSGIFKKHEPDSSSQSALIATFNILVNLINDCIDLILKYKPSDPSRSQAMSDLLKTIEGTGKSINMTEKDIDSSISQLVNQLSDLRNQVEKTHNTRFLHNTRFFKKIGTQHLAPLLDNILKQREIAPYNKQDHAQTHLKTPKQ